MANTLGGRNNHRGADVGIGCRAGLLLLRRHDFQISRDESCDVWFACANRSMLAELSTPTTRPFGTRSANWRLTLPSPQPRTSPTR